MHLIAFSLLSILAALPAEPPRIASLIKEDVLKLALQEREVMTSARLEDRQPKPRRYYRVYAVMLIHAPLQRTYTVLTDYKLYKTLIPYVDESKYDPKKHELLIAGGIWKFKMASRIHFEEKTSRWVAYRVEEGSFTGMKGDIFFEEQGEKGTLVYLAGEEEGIVEGPAFVLERGAEIVFGFTARRMRSYIESAEDQKNDGRKDIPKPRRGF